MTLLLDRKYNNKKYSLKAFFYALIMATILIVPIMIKDNGYFLYYGDFNTQQIPFYQMAHDSILSGNIKWSSLTDLGSNFVGSYSFYLLGSLFFYLTLLLPSSLVPYAMGPLLILKISLCSLTAYIYLKRYLNHKMYAVIGGLLYAFSGFSIYNIFFNHFHEAMIIMPLLLWAVDEYMYCKRKGVVAITVCASAILNYYFFFGQVVFIVIYFFVKLFTKSYKIKFVDFIIFILECVLGFLMSMVIMLPSILAIINNSRLTEMYTGLDCVVYDKWQRYLHIFFSFFFPPDLPAFPNMTPMSDSKWASIAAYVPMFSTVFVFSSFKKNKKSWTNILFIILIVFAFIPILNSTFSALNSMYYARWFYMLTLIMILMSVTSLDNIQHERFTKGVFITMGITIICALVILFMPEIKEIDGSIQLVFKGLVQNKERFYFYLAFSIFGIIFASLITSALLLRQKLLQRVLCIVLCIFCVCYSSYLLWEGKNNADTSDEFYQEFALNKGEDITLSDIKEVRSEFYGKASNLGMYWQVQSISGFHSIIPASIIDFYNSLGEERLVFSKPNTDYYGIRSLLSAKYLFGEAEKNAIIDNNSKTIMPNYTKISVENGYEEFENKSYIPMGFMYDKYISDEEYMSIDNKNKHLALLKSLVLSKETLEKYEDITSYSEDNKVSKDFIYTEEVYEKDCENLKSKSCTDFSYNNDGFIATIENNGFDNFVFFSVSYDEGWTAYVNGEQVDIEKANVGFMAVKVDGFKTSEIVFKYTTPGFKIGIIISLASLLIFIAYIIVNKGFKRKEKYVIRFKVKNRKQIVKK